MLDQSIGCEACHGPGSVYSHDDVMRNSELAHLLGLKTVDASFWLETCGVCHGKGSGEENFDGLTEWQKIAHPKIIVERETK